MTIYDLMIKIPSIREKNYISYYTMQQKSGIYHNQIRETLKGKKNIKMDTLFSILKIMRPVMFGINPKTLDTMLVYQISCFFQVL